MNPTPDPTDNVARIAGAARTYNADADFRHRALDMAIRAAHHDEAADQIVQRAEIFHRFLTGNGSTGAE